jgi:hypothetical protein
VEENEMKRKTEIVTDRLRRWRLFTAIAVLACGAAMLSAQPQAPPTSPGQLDDMVGRIALYPDPLLAQILTASTYYDEIPDAAAYADQHSYLQGDELARAIQDDNLPWDPSVQALIPFPSVLDMMARDPGWTHDLGDAVLNARPDVMDAVQRMRQRAYQYGNLRDCPQYRVVADGPVIEIVPVTPGVLYVPMYDPYWIYARPRAGFSIGISFGPRIFIGASFGAFGWREPHFDWRGHAVIIDNHPWQRTFVNRQTYVHQYGAPIARRPANAPRTYQERHEVRPQHSDRRPERREERR